MDLFFFFGLQNIRMKVRGFGKNIYYYFFFSFLCKCSVKGTFDFHFSSPSSLPSLRTRQRRGEKGRNKRKHIKRKREFEKMGRMAIGDKKNIYICIHIFGDIFTQIMKLTAVTWRCTLIFLH